MCLASIFAQGFDKSRFCSKQGHDCFSIEEIHIHGICRRCNRFLCDPTRSTAIDKCIEDMKALFSMQDKGDISDYLGIKVSKLPSSSTIKIAQPQLIDSILHDLNYV